MQYLKTYEELNWRGLFKRDKSDKIDPKNVGEEDYLSRSQEPTKQKPITTLWEELEDCFRDLIDGDNFTTCGHSTDKGVAISFKFKLKHPVDIKLLEDYASEIQGRISNVDSKILYYHKIESGTKISFIFTYSNLSNEEVDKILNPFKYRRK